MNQICFYVTKIIIDYKKPIRHLFITINKDGKKMATNLDSKHVRCAVIYVDYNQIKKEPKATIEFFPGMIDRYNLKKDPDFFHFIGDEIQECVEAAYSFGENISMPLVDKFTINARAHNIHVKSGLNSRYLKSLNSLSGGLKDGQ